MLDLTHSIYGVLGLIIFLLAYVLVMFEEALSLRKSKPMLLGASLIWALVGLAYAASGKQAEAANAATHVLESYGELFLFLLVSITYVNVSEERRVFDVLRAKLSGLGLSFVQIFWLLGIITFVLSAVLANMTTVLIMGAVVLAIGKGAEKFIGLTCISIVVASNAGGAFSPFGDTTTLMIWQSGKLGFTAFFVLFFPAVVNWLIPAGLMSLALPRGKPETVKNVQVVKKGTLGVVVLFATTIIAAVFFQTALGLPAALGMVLGLALLQFWSYFLNTKRNDDIALNSFKAIERLEWDTLLFFLGVMLAVAGLGALGWLSLLNQTLYASWGPTAANTFVGLASAVLDNIPLVYAVLQMNPTMGHEQWLLVALTAGVGGSLLSIGSAAGIALMGLGGKHYTFLSHLRWAPAILLGYAASVALHLWLNAALQ
jgi:Na+/H+ antiporter NhaD/arsenite permease-like protein